MNSTPSPLSSEHKEKLREAKRELKDVQLKLQDKQTQDLSRRIEHVTSLIAAVQL